MHEAFQMSCSEGDM